MTDLIRMNRYEQEITTLQELLNHYHSHLQNTTFSLRENETEEKAFKRLEGIIDQIESDMNNLQLLIDKEEMIMNLFTQSKENKNKLNTYKNQLITQLLQMKKNSLSHEEYLVCRNEWDAKRNETEEEKKRRKIDEMLEDIQDERELLQKERQMVQQMLEEKVSMEKLIDDLRKCDNPFNCPHGRPTTICYTKEEIEKLFKRSGF